MRNRNETENNGLITGYECTPEYAHEEFALTMEMYEHNTGRAHKDNSRLVYHIRQAFKPDEVSPIVANRIGRELALEYTGGNHAFVVATHTDRQHIHNHIIFCAFNLEADGKFRDAYFNYQDVAGISDRLCKEYGLSVIEQKQGWRDPYNEWEQKKGITKEDKPATKRERLEEIIGFCLDKHPKDFDTLLRYLEDYSCYAKRRGKDISVSTPFSKRAIRLSSLSDEFDELGLTKRIEQQRNSIKQVSQAQNTPTNFATHIAEIQSKQIYHEPIYNAPSYLEQYLAPEISNTINEVEDDDVFDDYEDSEDYTEYEYDDDTFYVDEEEPETTLQTILYFDNPHNLKLIIDIQNSIKATNNIGYKRWAEKFNLEQLSQTLIFIEKHKLTLGDLQNMATQTPQTLQTIRNEIEVLDKKLQGISILQRHIGALSKNKNIYRELNNADNPAQFKEENKARFEALTNAQEYMRDSGYGGSFGEPVPTYDELKTRYAKIDTDKKKLWAKHLDTKNADSGIANAWQNFKTILNVQDEIVHTSKSAPEIVKKPVRRSGPSL